MHVQAEAVEQLRAQFALLEDIDNVFHGRTNVAVNRSGGNFFSLLRKKKKKGNDNTPGNEEDDDNHGGGMLNFDVLLNCLDGIERSDGIFTIITTNDVTKIDPALGQPRKLPDGTTEFISSRPGRVDKAIELTYMEPNDKRLMSDRILTEYPQAHQEVLHFINTYPDLLETPAQFQERCAQIALHCFWTNQQTHLAEESEKNIFINHKIVDHIITATKGIPIKNPSYRDYEEK